MVTFHNAKDDKGNIIHIDEVTNDNRAEHYYCVGCGGEMSAVLGEKRDHHFRHKEAHCSWESYLHKLGKSRLKERFDTQKEFLIKYYVDYKCDKSEECKLQTIFGNNRCNRRELVSFDLKKIFDTCEEEVTYKGYRADLMLSNSEHPEVEPLFLEISVTHDCEPDKLSSGIRIVELKITDEKDVLRPLVEEDSLFGQSSSASPYDNNSLPPIRFYNFVRIKESSHPFDRFWVSKDEKGILRGHCIQDGLNCRNVTFNHREDSIYEIAIPSEILIGNKKPNLYEFGMSKAIKADIGVRHCGLCDNFNNCYLNCNIEVIDKNTGDKKVEPRRVYMRQIPDNMLDKVIQANACQNYKDNLVFIYYLFNYLKSLPFEEWKNDNHVESD